MSKHSKFANEPLMYIHQSTQGKPSAPMQHSYTTPKKSTASAPTSEVEKKTIQTPIKRRPSLSSFHNGVAQPPQVKPIRQSSPVEENNTIKSFPSGNQLGDESKKKFKDMTIQEKVDYFINTPSHLPKMRCEVLTEEKKYRGVILDFEDNEVRMRVGRRSVFIKMEDVTEIQLLGLGF